MDRKTNAPVATFRDGRLHAKVWENDGSDGSYHTVTLAKTYEDRNGQLQDSHSFTGSEALRVAELAREAHAHMRQLRREQSVERKQDERPPKGPDPDPRPPRFRR